MQVCMHSPISSCKYARMVLYMFLFEWLRYCRSITPLTYELQVVQKRKHIHTNTIISSTKVFSLRGNYSTLLKI